MTLSCELVRIPAEGGLTLDALLRHPEGSAPSDAVVLYLHGKGGSFCEGPGRFVPESQAFSTMGWDHIAVNMRMHDLGYSRHNGPGIPRLTNCPRQGVSVGGGMWECLTEGILDAKAALDWLRNERHYSRIVLVGKSSGGYFATHFAAEIGGITGVALLSPVHSHRMPFPTWFRTPDEEHETVARARDLVRMGQGYMLIPLPEWYFGISAASLVERADEPANIWDSWMRRITIPTLCVYGGAEVPDTDIWQAGYEACPAEMRKLFVVPNADHSYSGSEDLVSQAVAEFVHGLS